MCTGQECEVVYECQVTFELINTKLYIYIYLIWMSLSYECQKWTHETYKRIKVEGH